MYSPTEINFEESSKIKEISCGKFHTLILLDDGRVFSFGDSKNNFEISQIEFPDPIVSVSSGWMHSLAISSKGEIYSWGSGFYFFL